MTPRISVIVATRNRRRLLARALASVDAQGARSLELVVIDDGSGDGTAEWLRSERPHDCIIANDRPRGAAAARNQGIARARGEMIAFLDDDDVWRPGYLETQLRQLDGDPGVEMVTTGHVEIDANGRVSPIDPCPWFDYPSPIIHMLAECPVHTMSLVACRRSAFARIGCLRESLEIVHDLDWYLRLLAAGGRVAHDPGVLVERAVPGGLVTRYRHWFFEERAVHRRAFEECRVAPGEQRRVRAARSLLFARIGFAKGDFRFGLARLAGAVALSPGTSARLVVNRWRRRLVKRNAETGRGAREATR